MGTCCTTPADRTRYIINEDYKIKRELLKNLLNRSQSYKPQIRGSVKEQVINIYSKKNFSVPLKERPFEYKHKMEEYESSEPIEEGAISYSINSSYKNGNIKSSESNKD